MSFCRQTERTDGTVCYDKLQMALFEEYERTLINHQSFVIEADAVFTHEKLTSSLNIALEIVAKKTFKG